MWLQKCIIRRPIQRTVEAKNIFLGTKAPGGAKNSGDIFFLFLETVKAL